MVLIERADFIAPMQARFESVAEGEGHCIFLSGEAGLGKTSLVKAFCKDKKTDCEIYQGTCDALFTPRPLAPLYDIAWQIRPDLWQNNLDIADRAGFFSKLYQELTRKKGITVVVFEDIHWADEATLDFIKFFARRITQTRCLFILTYRDNEIHPRHPLRNVLGQLSPDSFTRLQLTPLSSRAVAKMATEKGYSGEDVYSISGGNPFYVTEILASYSPGVPDNIKDSVLSVYNRQNEKTKQLWELLSVLPTGFELNYITKMDPSYQAAVEDSLDSKILLLKDGLILFKHELYRRTIEASLSPLLRLALNKKILDLFLKNFEQNQQIERIIHHAKNANEYELVVRFAPQAARQAACLGAHIEASKLYYSAIEYYQGSDKDKLLEFYESYAYECYLTNKHREAIIYTARALNLWKEKNNQEKTGNCMRFLSRLWWYEGNQKHAESYGVQAIEVLEKQPSSKAKAMAYNNMSRLRMSMDQTAECILWAQKAIAIAKEIDDEETLAQALNNMGCELMLSGSTPDKGIDLLEQSRQIALRNSYHEHVARVYTILGANGVTIKDYALAKKALDEGILYCEEKDLDFQKLYMLASKARLNLETGNWTQAYHMADSLLKNEDLLPVIKIVALTVMATIKIRKGDHRDGLSLLSEAKALAFETMELQRIIPAFLALMEYEWITGKSHIEIDDLSGALNNIVRVGRFSKKSRLYFWLMKTKKDYLLPDQAHQQKEKAVNQAELWENWGCPYEYALALFEGDETDKRKAITIIQDLGADAVYEKLKLEMRNSGIKSIPRGIRETTRSNPANLTERELEVLPLLQDGLQNKEIADLLFISAKTVDHHISAILFKLDVNSRAKAVQEAIHLGILK
jgi:DNA-binding CsgD family transcriptional regulator/tetratricopeptide (TPR) repeat protein